VVCITFAYSTDLGIMLPNNIESVYCCSYFYQHERCLFFLLVGAPSLLELLNRALLCIMYALAAIMLENEVQS